ncbi:MAG TPA: TSUP family transporter [Polyangiaceae bacterium]|nr:TSUP family transporter [Polyangiaceae bacterium]
MTLALGLLLSVLIGLMLGLFGGGGSILAVPILTYALGVPAKAAIASSLLIVGITSGTALIAHVKDRLVMFRAGLPFGLSAMVGAYAGGRLARFVPDSALLVGFGLVMSVTAIAMLRGRSLTPKHDAGSGPISTILLSGLGVGAIAGLLGAGGGFLIVPALVLLSGMPIRKAIATSLLVISMQSFAGFFGHLEHTSIPWGVVLPVTALAVVGGVIGGVLVKWVHPDSLRRAFAWLTLLVSVFVVGHQLVELGGHSPAYVVLFVQRWPWWVGGAAIAVVTLALLLVENKQLGVSTGCGELCRLPVSSAARASWRPRFLLGIVLGGLVAALLSGRRPTWGMGGLDQLVPDTLPRLGVLFAAGLLIGAGARLAGGCTSGHSIVGTALGARSSWLATALFLASGFATTGVLLFFEGGH